MSCRTFLATISLNIASVYCSSPAIFGFTGIGAAAPVSGSAFPPHLRHKYRVGGRQHVQVLLGEGWISHKTIPRTTPLRIENLFRCGGFLRGARLQLLHESVDICEDELARLGLAVLSRSSSGPITTSSIRDDDHHHHAERFDKEVELTGHRATDPYRISA